jgi:hypothetical protein
LRHGGGGDHHQAGCSQGGQNVLLHTVSFRNAF